MASTDVAAATTLFVVEHYDETGTAAPVPALDAALPGVTVLLAIRVPADDVVLALVEAADEQAIRSALAAAGWQVDRITPAVPAWHGAVGTS